MHPLLKSALLATLATVSSISFANADRADIEHILQNIAPVGNVCIEGEECATAAVEAVAAAAGGGALAPEDIYEKNCKMCHGGGFPGAPAFGDASAWAPRINKGMETLYSNAINGINAMPPKGNCSSCSDDDIKAVVDYFAENAQ